MSHLGLEVMLKQLEGDDNSNKALTSSLNKEIIAAQIAETELLLTFKDNTKIKLFDAGQSCCEHRYMTTNDNLQHFIGSTLIDVEILNAPNIVDSLGEHEVQFLNIKTSKGVITIETHNEHNGYYGGFVIRAETV